MRKTIIICSGYFNPLHIGHVEYLELAKKVADESLLIVIVNNDKQAILKKGKTFMEEDERIKIIGSLKPVDEVFLSIDEDRSVVESIKAVAKKYKGYNLIFAKGGDRFSREIPEKKICDELGIKIVDNLGEKIQSSTNILSKYEN